MLFLFTSDILYRFLSFFVASFFFFNDTATTEIYTLSLHDALPISGAGAPSPFRFGAVGHGRRAARTRGRIDRKSTRLNSSHQIISYAVFCLKKKKQKKQESMNTEHSKYNTSMDHLQHEVRRRQPTP